MKKMNLMIGMAGGAILTYMFMNKDMRKMAKKKVDCMFNTVDQVMGD